MNNILTQFIRKIYNSKEFIPLHAPKFLGNEKKYLNECIDTTFVSYVGAFVTKFEEMTRDFTGSAYAVATSSGTTALQIALQIAGVRQGDEVITQPLTFVATCNAIVHSGGTPVFVDVELDTLGMSPEKLSDFLNEFAIIKDDGQCYNKASGKRISACVPVHIFGFPARIDQIVEICNKYNIPVVEDAAESLGSFYKDKHTGTFGKLGILSYNGNKTITTGGGGMIITDDETLAARAKHITTTAKKPHPYEFVHDEIGYNFRMPNINAAVGVAQMEYIDRILENKRQTAMLYKEFCEENGIKFLTEPKGAFSNYWLNTIVLRNLDERNEFLKFTNENGVMTRPIWRLMNKLPMFEQCQSGNLDNSLWLEERVVNLPSSYRI
ncbi:MAG: LegC family aminotransferase [Candidatus Kapabacteria bacterium]|nr:LegC family aminotransferase [Candidatus Kapabacteria bacterium]